MSSFDFEVESPPGRPGRPLHVLGVQPCVGVTVERDPYIALNVEWQFWVTGLLYLWVKGPGNGYVELKVDERTGALWELVVITLPPPAERPTHLGLVDPSAEPTSVRLDPRHWQWRHTPDYSEPADRNLDYHCELAHSADDEWLTIWFSDELIDQAVSCGDVTVGISVNNELVALSAPLVPETEISIRDGPSSRATIADHSRHHAGSRAIASRRTRLRPRPQC